MIEALRVKQHRVARETILTAAADEIVEHGLEGLSLPIVARRAGVSHRTLYNYFENRETLLADLVRWSDELTLQPGGHLTPKGLDTLPAMIQKVWRSWEAQGNVYWAALQVEAASGDAGVPPSRKRRRQALASAVTQIRPDLAVQQRSELAALIHALGSPALHRRLVIEDGLSSEAAGRLVGWALATLRDALAAGNDPYRDQPDRQRDGKA